MNQLPENVEKCNAAENIFVGLFKAGIIDPPKVVRIALEIAVTVEGTLLLTAATMTEIEKNILEVTVKDLNSKMN